MQIIPKFVTVDFKKKTKRLTPIGYFNCYSATIGHGQASLDKRELYVSIDFLSRFLTPREFERLTTAKDIDAADAYL